MIDKSVAELTVAPLPEAIDGEAWQIQHSPMGITVSHDLHQMSVPLSGTDRDRYIRLRTMGQAQWSPRNFSPLKEGERIGVPPSFIACAEQMRITQLLKRTGLHDNIVPLLSPEQAKQIVGQILEQPDPLSPYAELLATVSSTPDAKTLVEALHEKTLDPYTPEEVRNLARHVERNGRDIVREAHQQLMREVKDGSAKHPHPTFKDTQKAASYLSTVLKATPKRPPPPKKSPAGGKGHPGSMDDETKSTMKEMEDMKVDAKREDSIDEEEDELLRELRKTMHPKGTREGTWGKATVCSIPMPTANKAALTARRTRAHDTGAIPRFMHRMCTDQRIFGFKRRAPGGTVLLDASGSMRLDTSEIDAVLAMAPCATIAMYSGKSTTGTITIIARNGHRADTKAIDAARNAAGGGNIIDGPALRWLAKQEEPRIWVCDGIVTGCHDQQYPALTAEAMALSRISRIKRIPDMGSALERFKRIRRNGGFNAML